MEGDRSLICIIGGGPGGIMAASTGASLGKTCRLYERNPILGKKLLITGKGRCNITNACTAQQFIDEIPRNNKFLYSALYTFHSFQLMEFFESLNVKMKTERGRRVFPASDRSKDILGALKRHLVSTGSQVYTNSRVKSVIISNKKVTGLQLINGKTFPASSVVLATGGKSYPLTGSSGDGYRIAKELGHNIIHPLPALVPLITQEDWVRQLEGLTLKNVTASLYCNDIKSIEEFGEMLFTDKGISGPIILTLGGEVAQMLHDNMNVKIFIDLKPALSSAVLLDRLNRDIDKYGRKFIKNSLYDLLPKAIIPIIIRKSGINEDKISSELTKEERTSLVRTIKGLRLVVKETSSFDEAIVTAGGVDISEVNASTMESRIVKGLFFAGEVLDIHGYTGGYNLQIAFSTGYLAGLNCF